MAQDPIDRAEVKDLLHRLEIFHGDALRIIEERDKPELNKVHKRHAHRADAYREAITLVENLLDGGFSEPVTKNNDWKETVEELREISRTSEHRSDA